ncbi:hypothetical protein O181_004048 [Austropuccinia psidii MF-1]|uniref:AB hydrolase-1 domain-containing protein n=1 Tax=Austropuccinia psidii MF-1 TaxID=1389203 RepID=A0A9Q3GE54_9BASI|nr:hypothetical protein [Austropuccinia psidii MF-1]
MPRINLCRPQPGQEPVADQIRQRRHPRDLLHLDAALLNNPSVAAGWNSLLGAIRSENSLPDDLRELLILRVAALNSAPYEWIAHEKVGRAAGLTTLQLLRIRDVVKPLEIRLDAKTQNYLTSLHIAGIKFADNVTRSLLVTNHQLDQFKHELTSLKTDFDIDRMVLDATATVAGYNMVSRVLITLDVADDHNQSVPIPGLEAKVESFLMSDGTKLTARCQKTTDSQVSRPWLMFCNSLLTDMTMWDWITPSLAANYNLVCFDQRGHGRSSVPTSPCTINQLADDIAEIVRQLDIPTPLHGLIGVSQGGATALAVCTRHPQLFNHYIVCDTQPRSPPGNRKAWEARIQLAQSATDGMRQLSEATVERWFPSESHLNLTNHPVAAAVKQMIQRTSIPGFRAGANALYDYVIDENLIGTGQQKVLLVAGSQDGSLPKVLEELSQRLKQKDKPIEFASVPGSGHLPMIDQPLKFINIIEAFLGGYAF